MENFEYHDVSALPQSQRSQRIKMSIDDFPDQEQTNYPNTPLSREACLASGCKPKDLLYKPLECFEKISADKNIQRMHYNFYEAKRRSLIKAVKQEKFQITQDMKRHKTAISTMSNTESFNPNQSVQGKTKYDPFTTRPSTHRSMEQNFAKSFHASIISLDQVDKSREKHMRYMQTLLKQEEKAAEKMKEVERQQQIERKIEEKLKRKRQKEENLKNESKRQLEIEKRKKIEQEEKIAKKKAFELMKKDYEENIRSQTRINERLTSLKQKQLEAEQKRKEHQYKTEMNLKENELKFKEKFSKRDQEEKLRKLNLENMKRNKFILLQQKRDQNQLKRHTALEAMEMNFFQKKSKIKEKLQERELKYEKYIEKKLQQMDKLRCVSVQRDIKIENTKKQAESIHQQRKDKLQIKQEIDKKRLEDTKKTQEINLSYKRELSILRARQLDESRERSHKRQEYQNKKLKQRLNCINEKTDSFISHKQMIQRERIQINTESEIQRTRIKDLVNQMSVRNKWDTDLLMSAFKTTPDNKSMFRCKSRSFRRL